MESAGIDVGTYSKSDLAKGRVMRRSMITFINKVKYRLNFFYLKEAAKLNFFKENRALSYSKTI